MRASSILYVSEQAMIIRYQVQTITKSDNTASPFIVSGTSLAISKSDFTRVDSSMPVLTTEIGFCV